MKEHGILKAVGLAAIVTGALLLSGCQPAQISGAEAGLEAVEARAASAAVADADRKYVAGPAWSARRVAGGRGALVGVDPADRKFYGQGYLSPASLERSEVSIRGLHPADVKFLRTIGSPEVEIHPADVKFHNNESSALNGLLELYLSLDPADRKFLAGDRSD